MLSVSEYNEHNYCDAHMPPILQERYKSIPDDIAKDLKGVLSQLRKHEALVHELAGIEQQVLKVLYHLNL